MDLGRDTVRLSTYDEVAEWYDGWVGSDAMPEDPFFPAVEALIGEVAGRRVCDLACGQGRIARHLAAMGASVTGIDLSERLLKIARRREAEEPRGIGYLHGDARRLAGVAGDSFDCGDDGGADERAARHGRAGGAADGVGRGAADARGAVPEGVFAIGGSHEEFSVADIHKRRTTFSWGLVPC